MVDLLYLAAAVAFIVGLKLLGAPRTARLGNRIAALGMLAAIVIALASEDIVDWATIIAGLVVGAVLGAWFALRIRMTAMPQMVAVLNGFGGLASTLVAAIAVIESDVGDFPTETSVSILLSITIGAVTFTGSLVAFGKLQELLPGRPLLYRGHQIVNGAVTLGLVAAGAWALASGEPAAYWTVGAFALAIGVLGVIPIGGADMPVVISLLNSLSGVAAAAAGFVIESNELIIGGALVGAAGMILTILMTKAMNRSLANVLFAGFGTGAGAAAGGGASSGDRTVRTATADDVAIALGYAESVMIVPGYGLAVAQAQHALGKLAQALERDGITVNYAIHPVAGRMPGHMNVLLAETDVPYEQLLDLEQADPMMAATDVVLILGANDVVNPSARDDPSSPIYGMPIFNVDRAQRVIVVKRSLSAGFAGIDNPLFYDDKTLMYFADAKQALEETLGALATL